ncbi:unnamed protein product [Boreogadus saida]
MSVKVERFSSPGKGHGLRAVSGVPAGARVWSAAPLAACVSNTLTGEVCSGCFTRHQMAAEYFQYYVLILKAS